MLSSRRHGRYSHDVLVHHDDATLLRATRLFVARGLSTGADVLVHGTRDRVALVRDQLGTIPGLRYGYDEEMYLAPMRTLFAYQELLAERSGAAELWVTGTVPLGETPAARAAWARYESVVNEALSGFPFRAMCTYDAGALPADVVEAARVTHPTIGNGLTSVPSEDHLPPFAFLAEPAALAPQRPSTPPDRLTELAGIDDLRGLRRDLAATGRAASALPLESVDELVLAVSEVAANGLVHGAPPVVVEVWTTVDAVVVQVTDSGLGGLDPLTGYRFPDPAGPAGLWQARRLVSDLVIDTEPGLGCRVLLVQS
ncbi:sensor histidine kinase [Nocardioides aquiterrae]|uniref:Anti-sigma factor RsbA family regulatory protein n=1 Tax=Nocardioides aquiterrae TaxID=203799 RepID=A0ABP4EYG1_9ACTN